MRADKRVILHIDMDAFFASIEQRDNPSYRDRPVMVGADPKKGRGRGVVSSSSYEARKFEIHSAQPISQAYRCCPKGIFLPVNMAKYQQVFQEILKILYRFTPEIEPVSIDEAFLDISGSLQLFGTPYRIGREIKSAVKKETGLTASVGIAPNKITAKIASGLKKPDGLVVVTEKDLLDFLHPLPVKKLWRVGEKVYQTLQGMGIETIGDLARQRAEDLVQVFGKTGCQLWKLAQGIDRGEVETSREIKSLGKELTFERDTVNKERIAKVLLCLSEKISRGLRKEGLKGRTITLKIRLADFTTFTRSRTIKEPTNFTDVIYQECGKLFGNFKLKGKKVRLLGVKVSNFASPLKQLSLFAITGEKKEKLYQAIDLIKDRFGEQAIHLGSK